MPSSVSRRSIHSRRDRLRRRAAGLALPARALPLAPPLAELRRPPRRLLCRLDQTSRRTWSHPLALLLRLARHGQDLTGLVLAVRWRLLGPIAGSVQDPQDLDAPALDPVRCNVGRAAENQLPRAGPPTGAADVRDRQPIAATARFVRAPGPPRSSRICHVRCSRTDLGNIVTRARQPDDAHPCSTYRSCRPAEAAIPRRPKAVQPRHHVLMLNEWAACIRLLDRLADFFDLPSIGLDIGADRLVRDVVRRACPCCWRVRRAAPWPLAGGER